VDRKWTLKLLNETAVACNCINQWKIRLRIGSSKLKTPESFFEFEDVSRQVAAENRRAAISRTSIRAARFYENPKAVRRA
jgi:hypothetical protein